MKNFDMKIIAVVLVFALFFTLTTSNAISVASIVLLSKSGTSQNNAVSGNTDRNTSVNDNSGTYSDTVSDTPNENTGITDTAAPQSYNDVGSAENNSSNGGAQADNSSSADKSGNQSSNKTETSGGLNWTTAKIVSYFNNGANKVKYNAKSITRNYRDTQNDEQYLDLPAGLNSIAKIAMNQFLKRDDEDLVLSTKEDIKSVFPVTNEDWVSKLSESDVSSAKIADNGNTYRITVKLLKSETNPSVGKGYGSVFDVLTPDMVVFDYPGLSLSNVNFKYHDGVIIADFNKKTGNMTYINYYNPSIISLTAKIVGINADCTVGMITIDDFTITY